MQLWDLTPISDVLAEATEKHHETAEQHNITKATNYGRTTDTPTISSNIQIRNPIYRQTRLLFGGYNTNPGWQTSDSLKYKTSNVHPGAPQSDGLNCGGLKSILHFKMATGSAVGANGYHGFQGSEASIIRSSDSLQLSHNDKLNGGI